MNERMKDLVGQAKFMAEESINKQISANAELNAFAEKFAELIVKECIDILPEKVKIDDLYDGRILVQCGMAIKEHFGVEE
jgi:hypothetical protein